MSASYFMLRFIRKKRQNLLQRSQSSHSNILDCDTSAPKEFKCRICLKEGNIPIFNHQSTFDIYNAITTFGGIQIKEDDDYPHHLCTQCYKFLENAMLFRQAAKETDKLLKLTQTQVFNDGVDRSTIEDNLSLNNTVLKIYNCKLCQLQFDSREKLAAHKNRKRHKNVRIQCNICFSLLTPQLYKKHLARHQTSNVVCEICGKLYRKANLVRHLQLHTSELPFQCKLCPYRGRFPESLKLHMRSHTGDKPYTCDKCELRFLTRSNLNRHFLTHIKEKPFKCLECSRGFHTKRNLDIHIRADHNGVKEFICELCGNKFATRKSLMRHERRVHKRNKMATGRTPLYLQAEYQKQNCELQEQDSIILNANNCMEYLAQ